LLREKNLKIPKEKIAKKFSCIFLIKLHGDVNTCGIEALSLEIA
jgi:hypothetical protein